MTEHNLPEPDDAPWLNLTQEEINQLRYDKQKLTDYGREKIRALMEEKKLLKECRQTGRTNATTEKVLKTVFSQMTEIEKTEGEIKVLQTKLELLKEMENHPSPVEEAYKRFFGRYPNSGDCWTDDNENSWYFFQVGYKSAKEDCKVVEEPKPKKLFDVIRNLGYSVDMCYEIVDAVKECLPDEHCNITDYDLGWNDVLRKIKDGLG
jgi:DNA repair ATPase RecN